MSNKISLLFELLFLIILFQWEVCQHKKSWALFSSFCWVATSWPRAGWWTVRCAWRCAPIESRDWLNQVSDVQNSVGRRTNLWCQHRVIVWRKTKGRGAAGYCARRVAAAGTWTRTGGSLRGLVETLRCSYLCRWCQRGSFVCGLLRKFLRLTTISRAIVAAGKFTGFLASECLRWNNFALRIRYVWRKTRVKLRSHSWFSLCIITKCTAIVCAGWRTDLIERK